MVYRGICLTLPQKGENNTAGQSAGIRLVVAESDVTKKIAGTQTKKGESFCFPPFLINQFGITS